jgi:peptidoglycan hydrolase-like protein with peptidoglycan-binding domain
MNNNQSKQESKDLQNLKLEPEELELKFGSKGPAVISLQEKLQQKGFPPGAIDGDFGDNTLQAVIAFQRSVNLKDDGIVGPNTRNALGL